MDFGVTVSEATIIWNWGEIDSFRQLQLFLQNKRYIYGSIIGVAKHKIHNSKQYTLCFKSSLASESSDRLCDFDDQTYNKLYKQKQHKKYSVNLQTQPKRKVN